VLLAADWPSAAGTTEHHLYFRTIFMKQALHIPYCPGKSPGTTLYDVLGCKPSASAAQLRRAFLARLPSAHPDRGGSAERFVALQQAFALLSNAEERAAYDERLVTTAGASPAAQAVVQHGQTAGAVPCAVPKPPPRFGGRTVKEEEREADAAVERARQQLADARDEEASIAALAAAYAARARLAERQGRPHHALFDAREALRLCPAAGQLQALVDCLEAAAGLGQEGTEQGDAKEDDESSDNTDWE
jgi:DnaJ domain